MEYLSPQGVLLPLVYGTTASPLWLELRGRSALQATPSWTVYRLACHRLLPWLRVTFAMVPDAAWPGSDQWPWSTAPATGPVGRLGRPSVSDPWGVGSSLSLGRPTCVQCPGPLGSCSPVCPLGVLCCVCGVLGHLAPVHRCARAVCCVACAVSLASWLLFTGAPARCVVLRVRCPGPPGSCSPVCPLGVLFCVCGVLGHHGCGRQHLAPPGPAQRPRRLALPPAKPAAATAPAPTQAAAQVTAQTADARKWGGELGPPTHAPPMVRHDAGERATSRGREGGDNERGGEPAAPQPANR